MRVKFWDTETQQYRVGHLGRSNNDEQYSHIVGTAYSAGRFPHSVHH